MEDYPWHKSLHEILIFESSHSSWVCDIPELDYADLVKLLNKCLVPEAIPAIELLGLVTDQKQMDASLTSRTFEYARKMHGGIMSCFASLALSQAISTKELIWIFENASSDIDVYDHALANLQRRSSYDTEAIDCLRSHNRL